VQLKPGVNSGTPEEQAFPAQLVAPVALQTRWKGLILISISISLAITLWNGKVDFDLIFILRLI
jgi:hypothetical protein